MKTLHIQAELQIPDVPDFFLLTNGQKLPISAVNQDGLRAIGEAWMKNLLAKAGKKPGNPGRPRKKEVEPVTAGLEAETLETKSSTEQVV